MGGGRDPCPIHNEVHFGGGGGLVGIRCGSHRHLPDTLGMLDVEMYSIIVEHDEKYLQLVAGTTKNLAMTFGNVDRVKQQVAQCRNYRFCAVWRSTPCEEGTEYAAGLLLALAALNTSKRAAMVLSTYKEGSRQAGRGGGGGVVLPTTIHDAVHFLLGRGSPLQSIPLYCFRRTHQFESIVMRFGFDVDVDGFWAMASFLEEELSPSMLCNFED